MKPLFAVILALAAASLPARAEDLTGTVVESMDSGGYTYLLLKTASGDKKWAAVTKANIKKGEKATITQAMDMKNFESPTLKRKFDSIAFGSLAAGSAPAIGHGGRPEVKGPIKVAKAAGPDGRLIAEVYAQKAALKGKEVVVTGKVVKYNPGILERNWAHLRDGSGKAKDGSDDITVLLKESAEVGQVITVRGKVVLDKDLGGMYKFPVALEDAILVK